MDNPEIEKTLPNDLASEGNGAGHLGSIMASRWWKWVSAVIGATIIIALVLPLFSCGDSPMNPGISADTASLGTPIDSPPGTDKEDGLHAPDFSLLDTTNNEISLADLLDNNRAVVIVFYRGFF
jgi:hypothetical protein